MQAKQGIIAIMFFLSFAVLYGAGCKSAPVLSPRDREAYEILSKETFVQFDESRFVNAVHIMRKLDGLNIYVDWEVLEWFDITGENKVTAKGFIPLDHGLRVILGRLSVDLPAEESVEYMILDGVVIISLTSQLNRGGFTPIHYPPENEDTHIAHMRISKLIDFRHESVELEKIFDDLRQKTKVPFFIDWKSIEPFGVTKQEKMKIIIGKLRADMAVHLLLRRLNRKLRPKGDGIGYLVINGVMCISSGKGLDRMVEQQNRFPKTQTPNQTNQTSQTDQTKS